MTGKELRAKIEKSPYRTQERFSAACNICDSRISLYCRDIRPISPRHLPKILKALGIKGNDESGAE